MNIFSLADFNIEKSMDSGQPIFNKENQLEMQVAYMRKFSGR